MFLEECDIYLALTRSYESDSGRERTTECGWTTNQCNDEPWRMYLSGEKTYGTWRAPAMVKTSSGRRV